MPFVVLRESGITIKLPNCSKVDIFSEWGGKHDNNLRSRHEGSNK